MYFRRIIHDYQVAQAFDSCKLRFVVDRKGVNAHETTQTLQARQHRVLLNIKPLIYGCQFAQAFKACKRKIVRITTNYR